MPSAKFSETMIGSKDLKATSEFYKNFLGMKVSNEGDGKSFLILQDPRTTQSLIIVADPTIKDALPSIEAENLEDTLSFLSSQGGKVLKQSQYATMKIANVQDPDGRQMCIWQTV